MTEFFKQDLKKYKRFTYALDFGSKAWRESEHDIHAAVSDVKIHWILMGIYEPPTKCRFNPPLEYPEEVAYFDSEEELLMECAVRGISPLPLEQERQLIQSLNTVLKLDDAVNNRQPA